MTKGPYQTSDELQSWLRHNLIDSKSAAFYQAFSDWKLFLKIFLGNIIP